MRISPYEHWHNTWADRLRLPALPAALCRVLQIRLFFQGKPFESLTYTCWAAIRDPHEMDDVGSIQADA